MWDFSYIVPSFLILSVFVGFYLSLPRLPLRKNRIFIWLICTECFVMAFDILSTWADMNHELFPNCLLYFLNSAYFIGFFARGFSFFLFTVNVLGSGVAKSKAWLFILELPVNLGILIVLSTPWTHLYYFINDNGYNNGPCYNLLYVIFIFYLVLSFVSLYYYRSRLVLRREKYVILWYNVILTLGITLRYTFPRFLLMDIFCLMALIVIYLSFENPDNYLEERTFIFNRNGLRDYLREINGIKPVCALVFSIKNYMDSFELYGTRQINQGIYLIENYLQKEFPKNLIFYYRNGRFIIFSQDNSQWHDIFTKLQARFRKPWTSIDTELYLDIGACIIDLDDTYHPTDILLKLFIEAFLESDKQVDNEISIFSKEMVDKLIRENEVKHSMDLAISNDLVEVFLQPIVDSKTHRIVGAEALSRIRDSQGNLISPALFIPIAEKSGKINQLGKQVFKKCCHFINDNDFDKLNLQFINVNLSPVQFMRSDLDESLYTYTSEIGAKPDFIHLEITEEHMGDEQLMEKQIASLSNKGFKFVLDDYGKGYSNIARLRKTPFINVKLDMSIVWDYCNNPDEFLPNEIKGLLDAGFTITAEGIEDEEMANKMRDIGCTYLQGFYFSKPIPMDEFLEKYSS